MSSANGSRLVVSTSLRRAGLTSPVVALQTIERLALLLRQGFESRQGALLFRCDHPQQRVARADVDVEFMLHGTSVPLIGACATAVVRLGY